MSAAETLPSRTGPRPLALGDWLGWLLGIAIAALAAALRLHAATAFNMTFDETTLVELARGVFERGYPFMMVGTMLVPLATYELVPYPMALSMHLLGISDFSARLPSVCFSTGTTVMIYVAAARWFDRRTGALAALLYAISPWAIYWGSNCFHPAQAQFLGFLTLVQAYPLMFDERPPAWRYYLAAVTFSFAYLSWEGIAFLLPVAFGAGLLITWGKWQWLRRSHLWGAVAVIGVVVVAQLLRRTILQIDYLMVGSGKSEVSMPKLVFTQFDYNPWFYIKNFFLIETHLLLSLVFVCGLLFVRGGRPMRYVNYVAVGAVFFLTNFLPFTSEHYVFWALPMFLIGAAAATFALADRLLGADAARRPGARACAAVCTWLLVAAVVASAGPFGFKFYDMAAWEDTERQDLRLGLASADYFSPIRVLEQRRRPDDVVITLAGLPEEVYTDFKGDYFLQSVTWQKVVYDPGAKSPRYVDKFCGNPVLRSSGELQDLLARHHRVWLLAAPFGVFTDLQDRDTMGVVQSKMRVVAESYDSRLYLWDH